MPGLGQRQAMPRFVQCRHRGRTPSHLVLRLRLGEALTCSQPRVLVFLHTTDLQAARQSGGSQMGAPTNQVLHAWGVRRLVALAEFLPSMPRGARRAFTSLWYRGCHCPRVHALECLRRSSTE